MKYNTYLITKNVWNPEGTEVANETERVEASYFEIRDNIAIFFKDASVNSYYDLKNIVLAVKTWSKIERMP